MVPDPGRRYQMSNLIPSRQAELVRASGARQLSRQGQRTLVRLEERTLMRMAGVQAEGIVQGEKIREIDHLAREAMSGQALLRKWADTLAHGDPLLHDELTFF